MGAAAFCNCSGNGAGHNLPDLSHLPDYVARVSVSVYDNDSVAFASMVQYPLARPYPLHDITDSAQMVAYYPVMVDDSLRSMATKADPGWEQYGWRGWALNDGEVWVDEDGIYDIAYMSPAEKENYDRLVAREMMTLTPDMQKGYIPVACYRQTGADTVYRIDRKQDDESYRLAVYTKGARRDTRPDRILAGKRVVEGSEMNTRYEFADSEGRATVYTDPAADDHPTLSFTGIPDISLTPIYWLDSLK